MIGIGLLPPDFVRRAGIGLTAETADHSVAATVALNLATTLGAYISYCWL